MRVPRIYQPIPLAEGKTIQLDAQATVHVARVLRMRQGDEVVVFNGEGGEYRGFISQLSKRRTEIHLKTFKTIDIESPLKITLGQGVSRGERMDYTIQKSVELGIHQTVPLLTERTAVNLNQERRLRRQQHWQTIVNSACEQSGRNFVPRVAEIVDLEHWLTALGEGNKFVLNHRAERSVESVQVDSQLPVYLLIGPEGGLTEEEIVSAEQAGFVSVRLGPRVLRTETAALAFISVLQAKWGDFT